MIIPPFVLSLHEAQMVFLLMSFNTYIMKSLQNMHSRACIEECMPFEGEMYIINTLTLFYKLCYLHKHVALVNKDFLILKACTFIISLHFYTSNYALKTANIRGYSYYSVSSKITGPQLPFLCKICFN